MEKFMSFMDKYIVPVAAKIGAQRHLVAVRDAFIVMIPITMVGALGTLINNLPLEAYKNLMASIFGENWTTFEATLVGSNRYNGSILSNRCCLFSSKIL